MTISNKIEDIISRASFIRKMFEEGAHLKAEFGAENVYDFSLGNPNLPPPEKFNEISRRVLNITLKQPVSGKPISFSSILGRLITYDKFRTFEKRV